MSASAGGGGGRKRNVRRAKVADQINQAVESTSNLLHLMQESSPSQVELKKLPVNLLDKVSDIKKTGEALKQLPRIISALDAYMESCLDSVTKLGPIVEVLSNMQNCQLKNACHGEEPKYHSLEKGSEA